MDILSILALSKANKALKAGGSSDPQVVFFDVTYDMLQNTASSDTTQSEIVALLEAGKYVIAKVRETNTNNDLYMPLTTYDSTQDEHTFDAVFMFGGKLQHAFLCVEGSSWSGKVVEITTQSPIN